MILNDREPLPQKTVFVNFFAIFKRSAHFNTEL